MQEPGPKVQRSFGRGIAGNFPIISFNEYFKTACGTLLQGVGKASITKQNKHHIAKTFFAYQCLLFYDQHYIFEIFPDDALIRRHISRES